MSSVPPTPPLAGDKPQRTFLIFDSGLSLFGRRWLVSPAGAGGNEFRTNSRRHSVI